MHIGTHYSVWGICVGSGEIFHFEGKEKKKKEQLFFPFQEALVSPEKDALA